MGRAARPRRRSSSTRTAQRRSTPRPSATASGDSASFTYPVSSSVTVGETAVPVGYTAAIDCGGGPQSYAGGPFAVTAPAEDGATLTCTITNTPQSTVRVIKNWVGRSTSTTIFVDRAGQEPFDVSTVAQADGESVSFDYRPSTPVTLGEVRVPAGYRAFINCGRGPSDLRFYSGGPYSVAAPPAAEHGHHLHRLEHSEPARPAGS